eukprot:gene9898-12141_t
MNLLQKEKAFIIIVLGSKIVVPKDIGFLDSSTLLILDTDEGIFYSSHKGNVKGLWNNLHTNNLPSLGCNLEKFNIDQSNKRIYIISTNSKCDNTFTPAIFVFDLNGKFKFEINNSNFNTTLGVAGDAKGNIWIVDVNEIFIFNVETSTFTTIDPVPTKIAYNGITVNDDSMFVSVPNRGEHDLVIELDIDGNIQSTIELVGNTTGGVNSGIPGSLAIHKNTLVVEVPYASKTEGKDVDIIQLYSIKDPSHYTFKSSWGGHSCKSKNILCIPFYGLVFVP